MNRFIPQGVAVGGLGRRFVAALIDTAPLVLLGMVATRMLSGRERISTVPVIILILSAALVTAFVVYQWWAYGTQGAGVGARLVGLRLVGMGDGHPIGWRRWFLRQLVFLALMASVVGGILLVVFLVIHERRQGWHDLAARAIIVQPKLQRGDQHTAAPSRQEASPSRQVLLPRPASSFASHPERADHGDQYTEPTVVSNPAPTWMPRLQTHPLEHDPGLPAATSPARRVNQGWIPLPTPSSIIEPAKPMPRIRARDAGDEEDLNGTRISAPVSPNGERRGHEGWYVRLDDGREVELSVTVLLGRNPQKAMDDHDVHLVPAGGDGRMISRTHVLIGTDARGVFVLDRGSTNGTALVTRGGGLEPCPAGVQMRVGEGTQVSYGNRWFTALRRPEHF